MVPLTKGIFCFSIIHIFFFFYFQSHEARKSRRLQHITALKKKEHEKELMDWEDRFSKRQYDSTRRGYEDTLKHAKVKALLFK